MAINIKKQPLWLIFFLLITLKEQHSILDHLEQKKSFFFQFVKWLQVLLFLFLSSSPRHFSVFFKINSFSRNQPFQAVQKALKTEGSILTVASNIFGIGYKVHQSVLCTPSTHRAFNSANIISNSPAMVFLRKTWNADWHTK